MSVKRLCALGLGLWAFGLGWPPIETPVFAQVNMPDPALIHGKAIPAPELPNGTVTVRVVRESIGNNIVGQDVRVVAGGSTRTATTDAQGRAEFQGLSASGDARAETTVDGEALVSDPFTVPTSGGLRVILVAGLAGAAARRAKEEAAAAAEPAVRGTVVLGSESRILMEFRDDSLQVFYMLDIVNNARNRVDIGGPLVIDLPTGAGGATTMEGSTPAASVNGDRVTVQGPFPSGTTPVQVGFRLLYTSARVTVEQRWPVAVEEVTVGIERVGQVGLASEQFAGVSEVRSEDGTAFLLARGSAIPAGGTLSFQLTGLPVHSSVPRYVALTLAVGILAFGGWLAFSGRSIGGDARRRLIARRETLLGDLAQIERRRRDEALDSKQTLRRQKILSELEQIYGELDDQEPLGGGEGVAA